MTASWKDLLDGQEEIRYPLHFVEHDRPVDPGQEARRERSPANGPGFHHFEEVFASFGQPKAPFTDCEPPHHSLRTVPPLPAGMLGSSAPQTISATPIERAAVASFASFVENGRARRTASSM